MSDWIPGISGAVTHAEYHERVPGRATRSTLEMVGRAPSVYRQWLDGYEAADANEALVFGSALHCAVLEPARFTSEYAVRPDFGDCRRRDNRAARDAWEAHHAGAAIITSDSASLITTMCGVLREHPIAGPLLLGECEVTARWIDDRTGLQCQCRADAWHQSDRILVDLKTTVDASPVAFARSVANYGYHRQEAWYRDGFAECGERPEHFVFVAIEKSPPHLVGVYTLDESAVEIGRIRNRANLSRMAECVRTGVYPGLAPRVLKLELPKWAR